MKRYTSIFLFAAICMLFSAGGVFAQTAPGRIEARVLDIHGAAVPGAFVRIQSKTNAKFTAGGFADGDGKYLSDPLPAGEYTVSCDVIGMKYLNESVMVRDEGITHLDVTVTYGANCQLGWKEKSLELNEADRKEIIALVLKDAVLDHLIPDGAGLLKQKGSIVLSLENIKREWVTAPDGVELTLLTKEKIQEKADRGKDFLHLAFNEWKVGKNCVFITLSNGWAVGKNSESVYLSGGGSHYLYQKENGIWIGKIVGGWIS